MLEMGVFIGYVLSTVCFDPNNIVFAPMQKYFIISTAFFAAHPELLVIVARKNGLPSYLFT
jgi:hypothetical protein